MAKFVFKMENILEIKRKLEEQAKIAYAEALAALAEQERILSELKDKRHEYEMRLTGEIQSVLKIDDIRTLDSAIEVMKYKIQVQIGQMEQAKVVVERARVALQSAAVERKTYEKLKEKAFEEYKKELNIQEKKEIDELVSYTYGVREEIE